MTKTKISIIGMYKGSYYCRDEDVGKGGGGGGDR